MNDRDGMMKISGVDAPLMNETEELIAILASMILSTKGKRSSPQGSVIHNSEFRIQN